jgi:hypothetical protein
LEIMQFEEPQRDEEQASRALVPASRGDGRAGHPATRPQAPFLTQLLACEHRLEPFRRHRRGGPEQASACYGALEPVAPRRSRLERML